MIVCGGPGPLTPARCRAPPGRPAWPRPPAASTPSTCGWRRRPALAPTACRRGGPAGQRALRRARAEPAQASRHAGCASGEVARSLLIFVIELVVALLPPLSVVVAARVLRQHLLCTLHILSTAGRVGGRSRGAQLRRWVSREARLRLPATCCSAVACICGSPSSFLHLTPRKSATCRGTHPHSPPCCWAPRPRRARRLQGEEGERRQRGATRKACAGRVLSGSTADGVRMAHPPPRHARTPPARRPHSPPTCPPAAGRDQLLITLPQALYHRPHVLHLLAVWLEALLRQRLLPVCGCPVSRLLPWRSEQGRRAPWRLAPLPAPSKTASPADTASNSAHRW